jgi:DNA-binding MarR family transcriptional regulator
MIQDIGYRMADNSRMLRRLFDERVRDLGLTAAQARLLLSLNRHAHENQAFHAEQLEVEPITLTRIIDRMEDAGWIERKACPNDRRARILHLTDKSRSIVSSLQDIVQVMFEDVLRGLDQAQRQALLAMLEQIGSNLVDAREMEVAHG